MNQRKYDVAISFAEEDRNVALALALALELAGFQHVYYYPDNQSVTIGRKLEKELKAIYSSESMFCVVLLSKSYFKKYFTQVELKAIRKRMKQEKSLVYMIPVVLDKVDLNGNLDLKEITHIKWEYNPKEIANHLKALLGAPKKVLPLTPLRAGSKSINQNVINKRETNNQVNNLTATIK